MEDDQQSDMAEQALRQLHQDVNVLAEGLAHSLEGFAERIAATDDLAAQISVRAGRMLAAHRTPAPLQITEAPPPPQPDAVGSSLPPVVRP